ncbi:MAG: cytochrome c peroxidase [Polyangiaceae bacterium]
MIGASAASVLASGCGPSGAARAWSEEERRAIGRLEWTGDLPSDPTNRFAGDPRAAALGKRLFFDSALSRTGHVSCAGCHDPGRGFSDGREVSVGRSAGRRNAPSLLGAAYSPWLFRDGRKDSLWAQAMGPLEDPTEHALSRLDVVRRLASVYGPEYESTFGPLPVIDETWPESARPVPEDPSAPENAAWVALGPERQRQVNTAFANAGKAIAAWERLLVPGRAPFDEYARAVREGRESSALSPAAVAGLRLFVGKAGCVSCHDGPRFTLDGFHNLGLPGRGEPDRGRSAGASLVLADPFNCTGAFSDAPDRCAELGFLDPAFADFEGAFRTPSLREVARTAPYMHAGQLATLADVVAFYDTLPGQAEIGHREATLRPLGLTETERAELVAFLESLTSDAPVPAGRALP